MFNSVSCASINSNKSFNPCTKLVTGTSDFAGNNSDCTNSDQSNLNYTVDPVFGILPTVTISGLNSNETLKELVCRKQLLRGYKPKSYVIDKMETKIVTFNPNLGNFHTMDKVFNGTHEFQKDDMCILRVEDDKNTLPITKSRISNVLIAGIANFLFPFKKPSSSTASSSISIPPVSGNTNAAINSANCHFYSDYDISTCLERQIQEAFNHSPMNDQLPSSRSLLLNSNNTIHHDFSLISGNTRNKKKSHKKEIHLEVPAYYKSVSKYKTITDVTNSKKIQKKTQQTYKKTNLNSIYSYVQKVGAPENGGTLGQSAFNFYNHQQASLTNQQANAKKNWFSYAIHAFKQFWIDLWNDLFLKC
ncbi:hypothetical protein QEN19_003038 [Hanseniaspora menglaensis]